MATRIFCIKHHIEGCRECFGLKEVSPENIHRQ